MKITRFLFLFIAVALASCSMVKNPQSANFNRVKYNSHLKLAQHTKKELPKTVESFQKEEMKPEAVKKKDLKRLKLEAKTETKTKSPKLVKELIPVLEFVPDSRTKQKMAEVLEKASKLEVKNESKRLKQARDDWWEDDIEDWPWLEIVLAVIAVLLIAILIVVFIELIGAIIGSLLGLILLLALAYILYVLWVE